MPVFKTTLLEKKEAEIKKLTGELLSVLQL